MSNGLSDAVYKSLLSTVSSDALTKLNFKYNDEYPKKREFINADLQSEATKPSGFCHFVVI